NGSTLALRWSWGLSAAVLVATMLRLLQDVFAAGPVGRDRLFGCVTVYILIGLLWSYLYAIVAELSPGSFTGLALSSKSLWVGDLMYFSFDVMTSVALTDTRPVRPTAQMLVLLQEFAAVFYMAFVIARLVGMCSVGRTAMAGSGDEDGEMPKRKL